MLMQSVDFQQFAAERFAGDGVGNKTGSVKVTEPGEECDAFGERRGKARRVRFSTCEHAGLTPRRSPGLVRDFLADAAG
jgi:hypothetical protein